MSDSVRPHRWQPTRLPRPWGSPGKNTGVGCHFLLQCMKVKSESEVTQSCLTLATPWMQPTRLLRPWDFPGKSTGVECHCLLCSWPIEGLIFLSFSSHQVVVLCLELAGSWCQLHQLWLWDPPSPALGKSTSLSSPAFQIISGSQDSPNSQEWLMGKVCSSLMAFMVIVLKKAFCTKTSLYLILFDPQNKHLDMDKY